MTESPALVQLWLPAPQQYAADLESFITHLEDELDISIFWRSDSWGDTYDFISLVQQRQGPDVAVVDADLANRLALMNALLPLTEDDGFPTHIFTIAPDSLWVRSLCIIVPANAANPAGGRAVAQALLAWARASNANNSLVWAE